MMRKVSVSVVIVATLLLALSAAALAAHNEVVFRFDNATEESHRVVITSSEEGEKRLTMAPGAFGERLIFNATAWWLSSETHKYQVEIFQNNTNRRVCKIEYSLVNSYHFYADISDWDWKYTAEDSNASTQCSVYSTHVRRDHTNALADTASTIIRISPR